MKQHPRLIEVLQRADSGPIMEEADFERNLLGPEIKKLVEEYQIVFTGDIPAGELIRESELTFMVTPEAGDFDQIEFSTLLGRRLSRAVRKHEPVRYADIDGTGE